MATPRPDRAALKQRLWQGLLTRLHAWVHRRLGLAAALWSDTRDGDSAAGHVVCGRKCVAAMVLVCALPSCVSLRNLTAALEERNVQSCLYTIAFGIAPPGMVRIITGTGGASLRECHELR